MDAALLSPKDAAAYLGISRRHFDEAVRPFVPFIDMKAPTSEQPLYRFARADLDAFWAGRRKEKKSA